jgi:group II intron reverse transcriptase/maturase
MQSLDSVSTKRQRIAQLAKQAPDMAFTSLSHHIDIEWLQEAYRRTRKDGALGVDGQSAEQYAERLEENLQALLDRVKAGTYRAPPVRRAHIPKGGKGSETRPIGIPTFEDKVLQRAVVMLLECVYEQDFLDCSYGFRPGRSAHGALDAFWKQAMAMGGGWVIEVDIQKYFDALKHCHLREMLRQRVRDGVLVRLIGKWLNAGVLEDGVVTNPIDGSPQGGVVSPILANVYLHEVLDKWFEHQVKPRLRGRAFLVRYADDAVLTFECEEDARRVMDVLPKRFAKYGLTLHPDKTRLVPFQSPSWRRPRGGRILPPQSFDLLGFPHYWGKSRRGRWAIKRKTAGDRFTRALRRIAEWGRRFLHEPLGVQHRALSRKLKGHYGYYGITGNSRALVRFRYEVERRWRRWLARRSQQHRMSWEAFNKILERFPLPNAVAVHSVLRLGAKP